MRVYVFEGIARKPFENIVTVYQGSMAVVNRVSIALQFIEAKWQLDDCSWVFHSNPSKTSLQLV